MAELPRYRRLGIRSAQPGNIDFANFREGERTAQVISQQINKMGDFVFEQQAMKAKQRGREAVEEQGAQAVLGDLKTAGGPKTIGEREAFAVANRVASAELETSARQQMNRIYTEGVNANKPLSQIQAELADVTDGFPAALADFDPETAGVLRARLQGIASQTDIRYSSFAAAQAVKQQQGQAILGVEQRVQDIYATATSSQDAVAREAAVAGGIENLATYMRDLQFPEDQISRQIIGVRKQVVIDSAITQFQRLPGIEEKQAFLADLQNNVPRELGVEDTRTLIRSLGTEINNTISVYNGEKRNIASDIRDQIKILTDGGEPNEQAILAIQSRIGGLPPQMQSELQQDLQQFVTIRSYTESFRKMSPGLLQNTINDLQGGIEGLGDDGLDTLTETGVVKAGNQLLNTMNTQIAKDPLSFAVRVGHVNFKPLDMTSDEAFSASAAERIATARTVASIYEIQPRYLTNEEANNLSEAMKDGDKLMRLTMLQGLVKNFREAAPDVLSEVESNIPGFAHVGGLMVLELPETAKLALEGYDIIAKGYEAKLAKVAKGAGTTGITAQEVFAEITGQSLLYNKDSYFAGYKVAEAIYTQKMFDAGKTEFDESLWEESVQASFGRTGEDSIIGGNAEGGFSEIRGEKVLLPVGVSADQLEDLLDDITYEELIENTGQNTIDPGLMKDINDKQVSSDVYPIMISEGYYYLARDTDNGPRLLGDDDGKPILLNVREYIKKYKK